MAEHICVASIPESSQLLRQPKLQYGRRITQRLSKSMGRRCTHHRRHDLARLPPRPQSSAARCTPKSHKPRPGVNPSKAARSFRRSKIMSRQIRQPDKSPRRRIVQYPEISLRRMGRSKIRRWRNTAEKRLDCYSEERQRRT